MIGETALCTGGSTYTPASGKSNSKGGVDEGRRQGGRRVEDFKSDLQRRGASVDRVWLAVPRAAGSRTIARPSCPREATRNGSRWDWLRGSRRSPRKARASSPPPLGDRQAGRTARGVRQQRREVLRLRHAGAQIGERRGNELESVRTSTRSRETIKRVRAEASRSGKK